VDFQLTVAQQRLQAKYRELAADFATRSAVHDRDASHPSRITIGSARKGSWH
jgi:hypothetical protein